MFRRIASEGTTSRIRALPYRLLRITCDVDAGRNGNTGQETPILTPLPQLCGLAVGAREQRTGRFALANCTANVVPHMPVPTIVITSFIR